MIINYAKELKGLSLEENPRIFIRENVAIFFYFNNRFARVLIKELEELLVEDVFVGCEVFHLIIEILITIKCRKLFIFFYCALINNLLQLFFVVGDLVFQLVEQKVVYIDLAF